MKTIYQLTEEEKEAKKASEMITKHKKKTKKTKLLPFHVDGDPCNTVFYCKDKKKGENAVNKYKNEHKVYWS